MQPREAKNDEPTDRNPEKAELTQPLGAVAPEDESPAGGKADVNATLEALAASLADIQRELSSLRENHEKRSNYDKTRETAFDRLYAELDGLKKDQAFESIRPLFIDLILLYDRVENMAASAQEERAHVSSLESIKQEILEILYRRGVEPIQSSSPIFDPSIQKAIMIDRSSMAEKHNTVSRVLRRGFRYYKRLIRPEEVAVARYGDDAEEHTGDDVERDG